MKILNDEYFGVKINHIDATPERISNAITMLGKVNALLLEASTVGGIRLQHNPNTGTLISGSKGGAGDGGFRLTTSSTGKPGSAHKEGMAVDVADIGDKLDTWITRDILVKYGLYREAVKFTPGWCHLQIREPKSKNRSFLP